ncbi:hypothetical protein DFA_00536 [Cavenderia fasciculata]|uniref:Uncharacterized protein n=1 Tax=Cavenderia fasciculata TaxID=261658 RepID=F4PSC9_CACFS|nr:uncharacterized protein DFA_00536 [Cavenderia fasciculata]EGG20675.1 hypothetical protein DFA_00536 [Cavenderia fasciculata]|eukprot:XP_004358525.1 hypothetical protein DFA_00536 [Cavenderia fasciculata]
MNAYGLSKLSRLSMSKPATRYYYCRPPYYYQYPIFVTVFNHNHNQPTNQPTDSLFICVVYSNSKRKRKRKRKRERETIRTILILPSTSSFSSTSCCTID